MPFQKGNKAAAGLKGGRRKSAYQELLDATWLNDVITGKIKIEEVEPIEYIVKKKYIDADGKLKTKDRVTFRFRTGMHAIAYHLLKGNDRFIQKVLDKLVASKTDITSDGDKIEGGFIIVPEKDKE